MSKIQTLPNFGTAVPGAGGVLAGIMRGALVKGKRLPDYALIAAIVPGVSMVWGEYGKKVAGADSVSDGQANTKAMLKANCPPAAHVASLQIEGHADWYVPARAELLAAWCNVPELFEPKGYHWSSTQGSPVDAFVQGFEYGLSGWNLKDTSRLVRPFRRIPLYHFPT